MTDPEELRARATSIFQQLRNRGRHETDGPDDPGATADPTAGDHHDAPPFSGRDGPTDPPPGPPVGTTPRSWSRPPPPPPPQADGPRHRPISPDGGPEGPILDPEGAAALDALIQAAEPGVPDPPNPGPAPASRHARAPDQVGGAATNPSLHTAPASPPPDSWAPGPRPDLLDPGAPAGTGPAGGADPDGATGHPTGASLPGGEHDLPVLPPTGERAGHPGAGRPLPRVIAIANQKGGVGKTTTAVNLGASLAELRYRVLVVDLDPQGNATTGLGINARSLESSVYDVILHDVPAEDVIESTTLRNLYVLPATIDLAGAEIELVPVFSRELRLRRALESVHDDYDFVLIDCPPSLGLLTINGLAAASEVAVPIQCEYYALEGLGQLLRNVTMVQANLNARLELSTIILTMYDARTRLAEQVVNEVRDHFGDRVCRNVVPRTVRLSEAPSFGQPIIVFDASSRGSIAYRELAKEVSGGASQRVG